MRTRRSLGIMLIIMSLSAFVRAQDLPLMDVEFLAINRPSLLAGEPRKLLSGDFDLDHRPDLIALIGVEPVAFFAPAVYRASMMVDATRKTMASDIAVYPSTSQHRARLVTAGSRGVAVWELHPQERVFRSTPLSDDATRSCALVDLEGDGQLDVVALSEDGTRLFVLRDGQQEEVWLNDGSATSLIGIHWEEGSARQQIAILKNDGFEIRDHLGRSLREERCYPHSMDLNSLPGLGQSPNSLAWVSGIPGHQELHIVSAMTDVASIPMVGSGIIGLDTFDLNRDHRPDLLASTDLRCRVIGWWGTDSGDGKNFDYLRPFLLESETGSADCFGQNVSPLCVDLDGDHTIDIISPLIGEDGFLFARNRMVDSREPPILESCVRHESTEGVDYLELTFPLQGPDDIVSYEILVFRSFIGDHGPEAADPIAWYDTLLDREPETSTKVWIPLGPSGDVPDFQFSILSRSVGSTGKRSPDLMSTYPRSVYCPEYSGRKVEGINPGTTIDFMDLETPPGPDESEDP